MLLWDAERVERESILDFPKFTGTNGLRGKREIVRRNKHCRSLSTITRVNGEYGCWREGVRRSEAEGQSD